MAETDPFASSDDLYSIVVLGSMNPAIHHPRWYVSLSLITEEEASLAESRGAFSPSLTAAGIEGNTSGLICTSVFSQFSTNALRVGCVQGNWSVSTIDGNLVSRVRDICSGVFRALPHTPVSAYGLNFAFHRSTNRDHVGAYLATLWDRLPFGLVHKSFDRRSATFRYISSLGERELTVVVEASARDPKKVFIGINTNHRVSATGPFDLTPLIAASVEEDKIDAERWLTRVQDVVSSEQ